jgi:hypothetical protein
MNKNIRKMDMTNETIKRALSTIKQEQWESYQRTFDRAAGNIEFTLHDTERTFLTDDDITMLTACMNRLHDVANAIRDERASAGMDVCEVGFEKVLAKHHPKYL